MINYEYHETNSKEQKPEGEGWIFWGRRKTPDIEKVVWRRDKDKYGEK